jgi:hypothetical protein
VTRKGYVLTPGALAKALQVCGTVPGVARVVNRAVAWLSDIGVDTRSQEQSEW